MSSNIKGGGAIFKETPTIANNVVGQTIDTINQQLNENNTQNTENKLELDFLKQVFIIDKENKTVTINPEYKLIVPNDFIQG